jgi:hypothetical protein
MFLPSSIMLFYTSGKPTGQYTGQQTAHGESSMQMWHKEGGNHSHIPLDWLHSPNTWTLDDVILLGYDAV